MSKNKKRHNGETQTLVSENANNEKTAPLTEHQVYDVLKFAQSAYNAYTSTSFKFDDFMGTYSPHLTNERLSEIGLKPKNLKDSELKKIIENPVSNQNQLIGYSEFLKFTDMIAKRSLGYLGNLPAFDYTFTCINAEGQGDYSSKEYKEDLKVVKDFFI